MKTTRPTSESTGSVPAPLTRGDALLALAAGGTALALYMRTLAPGLLAGDPGEFQFAAWRLGLAHPTGYPLYLLLGGGWQHALAPAGVDPAFALNLFSGVTAALAVALFFVLLRRIIPGPVGLSRGVAGFGALLLAANPTFWSQALIAEVYALHGLIMVLILLAALTWDGSPRRTLLLAGLLGLGLTHHRTTVFLLPGVGLALWLTDRGALARWKSWGLAGLALALPQLLYLYIPLRGTPEASPWYFPTLGGETLPLYTNTVGGFLAYLNGSVFAVSFFGPAQALARLPEAGRLWLDHFTWFGVALMLLGLITLVRTRRWPLLALTLPFAAILQVFNLFYGIGDIYVYYIPLYLMGAVWAGVGIYGLGSWAAGARGVGIGVAAALLLPIYLGVTFFPLVDQSQNRQAEAMWAAILAADPPAGAVLVSNDRNEIVPLYYVQFVQGKRQDLTGIFPLLTPADRFADVGSTLSTALALAPDRPVVLIKPMPGLESRFALTPLADPLVAVVGDVAQMPPQFRVDQPFGPLTLLGFDWQSTDAGSAMMVLHWRVDAPVDGDYTATVQLFDASGTKVGQDDRPPGGLFYPTGLWKPGDILLVRHPLAVSGEAEPVTVLAGMYTGPDFTPLAPALEIPLR